MPIIDPKRLNLLTWSYIVVTLSLILTIRVMFQSTRPHRTKLMTIRTPLLTFLNFILLKCGLTLVLFFFYWLRLMTDRSYQLFVSLNHKTTNAPNDFESLIFILRSNRIFFVKIFLYLILRLCLLRFDLLRCRGDLFLIFT